MWTPSKRATTTLALVGALALGTAACGDDGGGDVDATVPGVGTDDAATEPADTGTEPADTGTAPADTGTSTMDMGTGTEMPTVTTGATG